MNANYKTLIGAAAILAATADAQITYLDADTANQPGTTNTTFADGSVFTPPLTPNGAPADNQWWERTGFANDSDILAVNGGSDAPVIRTTISGLTPGAGYDVYVYYWWADTFGNGQWDLGAGFTQAGITHFLYTDGAPITSPATHFANPPVLIQEGNRDMYEYYVGCTSATAAGTIDIYIDDFPGNDDRSWYDGVGSVASNCGGGTGTLHCDPANNHSGGGYATLANSTISGPGVLHLEATAGPADEFAYFLVSATVNDPGSAVSNGMLCLGAPIGRYAPAAGGALNSIGQFDAAGILQNLAGTSTVGSGYDVLAMLPSPPGGMIMSGSTWYFQCWFRDGQRSNFSNVIEFTF